MIPQSSDLRYFLEIAETLNLSRASERLGVVQPTLSQSLKRLEDLSGVPLFLRKKSGLELTRAGQILQTQVRALLNTWDHLLDDVKSSVQYPKGHFVLGAHPSVALYSFSHFVPKLLAQHPAIEISFQHGLSREVLEGVVSGTIDFGLVINPRRHPDLVIRQLAVDRVGLWRGKGEVQKQTLLCDASLAQTQALLKKLKRPFDRVVRTQSLELVADLAEKGAGLAILPERVAKRFDLVPEKDSPWYQDQLTLCFVKERQKSVAARVLIDAITSAAI